MTATRTKMLNAPDAELVDGAEKMCPSEKDAQGRGGVYGIPTTAAGGRFKVPVEWLNRYVTLSVETADVELVFGDSAVVCVYGQNSVVAPAETLTSDDGTGTHYFFGQHYDFKVDARHTHFAYDALASGRITIGLSSRQGP